MPAKKHKPEEIIGKLREVEIVLGQGGTTAEACRRIAVSEQTYYRWRKQFGGMDRDPAPFPTRYLIFNDIRLRGFWVSKWYATAPREEILALHNQVFNFMENAKIHVDIAATYPLEDWQKALAHANQAGKTGKVLFKP